MFRTEEAARKLSQQLGMIGLLPWSDTLPGGSGDPRFRVFVTSAELVRAKALIGEVPTNEDVDHAAIAKRNMGRQVDTKLTGTGIFVLLTPILLMAGAFSWVQLNADAAAKSTWGVRIFVLYFIVAFVLRLCARALGWPLVEGRRNDGEER